MPDSPHHNREWTWTTREGRSIPLRELTDTHLANIINMLQVNGSNQGYYVRSALENMYAELTYRGLDSRFLDGAPYPETKYSKKKKIGYAQAFA